MFRFAQLAFLLLLPFPLLATFVPEASAIGRFPRETPAAAPATIPPDTLWVPRDRAQKGLVSGAVLGAILGSVLASAVMENEERAYLEPTTATFLTLGRDAPSGVFKGVALAMVTTAVGAFLGRAIGAGTIRWEATTPGSIHATGDAIDERLRALRAQTGGRGPDARATETPPARQEPGTSLASVTRRAGPSPRSAARRSSSRRS